VNKVFFFFTCEIYLLQDNYYCLLLLLLLFLLSLVLLLLLLLLQCLAAYVCGERGGLILEDHHCFGVSLNGVPGLDIDKEKKLVEEKLNKLRAEGATEHDIEVAMKDLGMAR
jgi:hypothetical protein